MLTAEGSGSIRRGLTSFRCKSATRDDSFLFLPVLANPGKGPKTLTFLNLDFCSGLEGSTSTSSKIVVFGVYWTLFCTVPAES